MRGNMTDTDGSSGSAQQSRSATSSHARLVRAVARAMLARDAGAGVDIKSAETLVLGPECRRFSYAELETATNGYTDAGVIGEGGFGKARAALLR